MYVAEQQSDTAGVDVILAERFWPASTHFRVVYFQFLLFTRLCVDGQVVELDAWIG